MGKADLGKLRMGSNARLSARVENWALRLGSAAVICRTMCSGICIPGLVSVLAASSGYVQHRLVVQPQGEGEQAGIWQS